VERLDAIADLRDEQARARDRVALQRDDMARLRDTADRLRTTAGEGRDVAGDLEDATAGLRDTAAAARDSDAAVRDANAADRDRAAELADVVLGTHGVTLTASRARAGRAAAADDRQHAEQDRVAAAADRADSGQDRTSSSNDRAAASGERADASADREMSFGDRAASAEERANAGLDRSGSAAGRGLAADDRESATLDALTGTLLRGPGLQALQRDVDRSIRTGEPLTIVFLDVDGLKSVNDTGGHRAGDLLLLAVASAVRDHLRPYDAVVRFGGDEFVCGLLGIGQDAAVARIDAVNDTLRTSPQTGSVTAGFAELQPGDTLTSVIRRADDALYTKRARVRG
jgi:diguanylate cyclase (GGDEF)-like protein